MGLIHILIFIVVSIFISTLKSGKHRSALLLLLSISALYSLQPALTLRDFDFWLPTLAIGLSLWVWAAVDDHEEGLRKEDGQTLVLIFVLLLLIAASSYLPRSLRLFVSLPVPWMDVILVSIMIMGIGWGILRLRQKTISVTDVFVLLIIGTFVVLKSPSLSLMAARSARQLTGQSTELASAIDLNWIGFSYIAFRLLHVLRDRRSGRLPTLPLRSFFLYVFFFPAISAGPIDRVERFLKDLNNDRQVSPWDHWQYGATRISWGLLKKFVLADSLALIALNYSHVDVVQSRLWLWLLLYAYSFRIFFDFSGYTDIAIGIGALSGIFLPENFDQPYLQTDLGAFWNRWHITLAQWFRAYVFNPLTRYLRQGVIARKPWLIIFIGQITTMVLIGLWHGVTMNFLIWGAWHGVGLFIQNRWSDFQRRKGIVDWGGATLIKTRAIIGGLITFNFVSLGWVWFSTSNLTTAWSILRTLLGGAVG